MKKFGKLASVVLAVALSVSVAACSSGGGQQSQSKAPAAQSSPGKTMKIAHTGNEKTTYQVGMEAFKKEIEEKSGGKFKADIYPGSLGADRELIEALQIGTVDFAEINTNVLANIVPELGVIDLPYMFSDREKTYKLLDGEVGKELMQMVIKGAKVQPVAFWENGFRFFTNNIRPIKKPEDLKGLVMRSMQSNIHLETYKMWGANPTPMAVPEMITAMQQGVIQGHCNNVDTINANSMWEFQKHFSESRHFYGAKMLIFSPKFWNSLTDADKQMFEKAAGVARDIQRKEVVGRYDKSVANLKKNGMQIVTYGEMDIEAFKKSVQPIWDQYRKQYGDALINKISK